MSLRFLISLIVFCLLPVSHALAEEEFQAGRDYQIINQPTVDKTPNQGEKVEVAEFFSYACPACYRLNPVVEEWADKRQDSVEFNKIPVIFRPSWEALARAYYIAKAFDVESEVTPALFGAVQRENRDLSKPEAIAPVFAKHGVSEEDFINAYNFSSEIEIQLQRGRNLMQEYAIFEVPTFVVHGQYVTNSGMVEGNRKKLFAVLDYLVDKVNQQRQSS